MKRFIEYSGRLESESYAVGFIVAIYLANGKTKYLDFLTSMDVLDEVIVEFQVAVAQQKVNNDFISRHLEVINLAKIDTSSNDELYAATIKCLCLNLDYLWFQIELCNEELQVVMEFYEEDENLDNIICTEIAHSQIYRAKLLDEMITYRRNQ